MNKIGIFIKDVQHISEMNCDLSLSEHGLHCLVGKNGVGKTTLIRAFRNISNADTFIKTANPKIFGSQSQITYNIDDKEFTFSYDPKLESINCRKPIPNIIKQSVTAELPMPFGSRFNYAKSASEADPIIRMSLALESYTKPVELVNFLNSIYGTDKYTQLKEVSFKKKSYYFIKKNDSTYIREDYLSSGEFFLINLYRTIKNNSQLIVIDEVELSLDAAAQSKLTNWLRDFCETYECSILFTTHSLALMRTLNASELSYINYDEGTVTTELASYSYVKARLFGFTGWDKYILTEDRVLSKLIEHLIYNYCKDYFFEYKIIHIGPALAVVNLLQRNIFEKFLAEKENVIAVLDGDQEGYPHALEDNVYTIPIDSVEKELFERFHEQDFPFNTNTTNFNNGKQLFKYLQNVNHTPLNEIFDYIFATNSKQFEEFAGILRNFLKKPSCTI